MKKMLAVLTALLLIAGIAAALPTGPDLLPAYAEAAQDSFDTNYGFVAMNESSKITLQEESVWLTAKTANKGNIFDYIYKKPIDPNDFELDYTIVSDTTRDNGTHSRFDLYILPSAGAAPGDGVLIQLIQFALGADNDDIKHTVIVGSGPDGGWNNYAHFNADYSAALKLYSQNGVFRLSFNGTEYSFSGANAELLRKFSENGGAYLRLRAHFQENGESSYGGDYAISKIKDAAAGTARRKTVPRTSAARRPTNLKECTATTSPANWNSPVSITTASRPKAPRWITPSTKKASPYSAGMTSTALPRASPARRRSRSITARN